MDSPSNRILLSVPFTVFGFVDWNFRSGPHICRKKARNAYRQVSTCMTAETKRADLVIADAQA